MGTHLAKVKPRSENGWRPGPRLNKLAMPSKVVARLEALEDDRKGPVKRLTNFTPEYRLRIGHDRALFEVEGTRIIVYRIQQRKDVYR